ncbi:MAG: DNA polymerase Y family protein, partial [Maricaulis sp.]|nr:DNA polymerase Y family protein [Maricaulis sp.]
PARDPAHITRLFSEKLDRAEIDIGFGIDVVELRASETAPLNTQQSGLLDRDDMAPDTMARLTDRLVVRLGDDQVRRAARRESHIPERAAGWRRNNGNGTALAVRDSAPAPPLVAPQAEIDPDRPLLILARPEPAQAVAEIPDGPPRSFIWRRVRHLVHRAEGPERLAPEWWRDQLSPRSRDYFRVETREGRRFWLYREGLFGLETTTPEWFVHGAS